MRADRHPKKILPRNVQLMAPVGTPATITTELARFINSFKDSLNKTKSWTLARDLQINIDTALAREQQSETLCDRH